MLFSDIVAPGKPLIFGYHPDGTPEQGDLADLMSNYILGQSGGGKTTFLTYIIGASILIAQSFFDILDHFLDMIFV